MEASAYDLKQRVEMYSNIELFTRDDEILRLISILDCESPGEVDIKRAYKEFALQFHPDKLSTAITDSWKELTREQFDDAFKKLQGYFDDVTRIWKTAGSHDTSDKAQPTAWRLTAWKKTRRSRRAWRQVRQRHLKRFRRCTSCRRRY